MESLDSNMVNGNTSFINAEVKQYLLETAKWGKFLAIVGYIGIGFIVALAIIMAVAGSSTKMVPGMSLNMGVFGAFYIVFGALNFFPVYYLHQFSVKIKNGLNESDNGNILIGFQNLKSLFKFMGIFMIVILAIYALAIAGVLISGAAGLFK